jgi:hypothetical protein
VAPAACRACNSVLPRLAGRPATGHHDGMAGVIRA